jgi:hypothetical protein
VCSGELLSELLVVGGELADALVGEVEPSVQRTIRRTLGRVRSWRASGLVVLKELL